MTRATGLPIAISDSLCKGEAHGAGRGQRASRQHGRDLDAMAVLAGAELAFPCALCRSWTLLPSRSSWSTRSRSTTRRVRSAAARACFISRGKGCPLMLAVCCQRRVAQRPSATDISWRICWRGSVRGLAYIADPLQPCQIGGQCRFSWSVGAQHEHTARQPLNSRASRTLAA